jgi:hypothetical protein
MTYTDDGRWLAISRPRSVTVLDAQTFRVAAADISLPTDRPTDAIAMTPGEDHRLIVGTRTVAGRALTKDEWSSFLPAIPSAPACG